MSCQKDHGTATVRFAQDIGMMRTLLGSEPHRIRAFN